MEQIKKEKIWVLRDGDPAFDEGAVAALAAETGLSPICARLLYCRGYRTKEAVDRFLRCEDTMFHSPFLLKDVEKAVARIRRAVEDREKMMIYGDYDVDGVTAVSLLYLYLKDLGADVGYYIPSRAGEGYGLSTAAIDRLADNGVTCIITVDTGITAVDEVAYAKTVGIDMVITDHHECREILPEAEAVVNPHRPDCPYPFKELAGVGVIFKVMTAYECTLGAERGEPEIEGVRRMAREYADLVAIGTIADVMPITDENRLIVTLGLRLIAETRRVGLAALIEEASGGKKKKVTSSFIGFGIAPRINAAGRMSEASRAVELLLSETPEQASDLAKELCEINCQRQAEENTIAEQAYARIEREFDLSQTRVLVLEDNGWRQGIIGIVASRVTERYGLPSILVSFDNTEMGQDSPYDLGKGSGRSVKGVNLFEALTACEDLLVKFGGHELAAGLTVSRGNLDAFRTRINDYAATLLPEGAPLVRVEADCEIVLSDVNLRLCEELSRLEPFGISNPTPQFVLRDLRIDRITELGGGKHLKLLVSNGELSLFALCFSTTRSRFNFDEGDRVDLLCTVEVNEYRDVKSVQLFVQDFKGSARFMNEYADQVARYQEVRNGGAFTPEEGLLPDRDDCARVYTVLRREFRNGRDRFTDRELWHAVNVGAPRPLHFACLKHVIEIFHELKICGVEELEDGYRFDIYFNASRTSIEKSSILKKLKGQCKSRT
ncbi:MAG: single-stranded-DNA-specific exonuclease RecJ [Clostridia bacterium]|nr:single-stranded-DNA-specific exonuclease RecJ [Clostridia bacterium]